MFGIWHRTSSYPSLDMIRPAALRALHEAWRQARGFSDVPLASDMPVNSVQAVLPHMALVALGSSSDAHRYPVFGPALRLLLGRDPTGQTIAQAYPREISEEALEALARVSDERRPLFYRREYRVLGREFGYHRLMLPLREGDGRISHVALGIYPLEPDLRFASQWQSVVMEMQEKRLGQTGTAADWHTVLAAGDSPLAEASPQGDVWLV